MADNDGDAMDEGIGGIIGEGDDYLTFLVDVAPFAFLLYRGETLGEGVGIVIGDGEEDFACGVDAAICRLCRRLLCLRNSLTLGRRCRALPPCPEH